MQQHHTSHTITQSCCEHNLYHYTHKMKKSHHSMQDSMHHTNHQHMIQDFKNRFWIVLFLTMTMIIIEHILPTTWKQVNTWNHIPLLMGCLGTLSYFYGGWPFLKGSIQEIKNKTPGMMTLISLAISVAYIYSVLVTVFLPGQPFWLELITLIDIMLLGHWIEIKSVLRSSQALELLIHLLPNNAHRITPTQIEDVPLKEIKLNDIILIKPNEKIPMDGVIIEGTSYVNEALLTGESIPIKKTVANSVIGGALNGQGSLTIKVQQTTQNSYISKVVRLVKEAQQSKSKTQLLADKAAEWLTWIAILVSIITLISWCFLSFPFSIGLKHMVTVMVTTCPHALGLAIPLVVAISTTLAAQHGLLIRQRTAFENARKITTLVFDKTGTLSQGELSVTTCILSDPSFSEKELIQYAASVEQHSEHPIAKSIIHFAKQKNIPLKPIENFQSFPGEGVQGHVQSYLIKIMSLQYLKKNSISFDATIVNQLTETIVFVLLNDKHLIGYFTIADQVRADSYSAICLLKKYHIKTVMLTGDHEAIAKSVAQQLKIDTYYAELLPHQKLEMIRSMQNQGEFVAMVGDGVNDAPALAQADVGIAIGAGTDIAAETADIILINNNLLNVVDAIHFGRATYKKMVQNLWWATGYNVLTIPLATGLFSPLGITLSPALGAILMSISTIIVAFNAQLLKRQLTH
jgi:P-type Cu2+ transporter